MSRIFITADTHFGDDAIRRYENRPFESTYVPPAVIRVITENARL